MCLAALADTKGGTHIIGMIGMVCIVVFGMKCYRIRAMARMDMTHRIHTGHERQQKKIEGKQTCPKAHRAKIKENERDDNAICLCGIFFRYTAAQV